MCLKVKEVAEDVMVKNVHQCMQLHCQGLDSTSCQWLVWWGHFTSVSSTALSSVHSLSLSTQSLWVCQQIITI